MKIKEGFMLRTVAGQNVVVPVGAATLNFNGMLSFNDSGAYLWKLLSEDRSDDELVAALCEEYEVEKETAANDVSAFVKKLKEAQLLYE